MNIFEHAAIFGCLLMLAGCAATPPNVATTPTALILDVAGTPQWKAGHEVYANWSGREVKLPICISFQSVPNVITHAIYFENGKVTADYGTMRIVISARPETALTPSPMPTEPQAATMRQARMKYWAFVPASQADMDAQWTVPTPAQLKARIASGEVQVISVVSP